MDQTIYDPLDMSSSSHDLNAVDEAIQLSTALLIYYLLRGRTPLISQTQAFDSRTVLSAATEGPTSAAFRWLVKRGHLRVMLFRYPRLVDAFVAALDNPDFVFLSWPELNGPNFTVDRAEVKEALLHRRPLSDASATLEARVEAILALNNAVGQADHGSFAREPSVRLSSHLADAARVAAGLHSPVDGVLQRLTELNSDQWSAHFAELNRLEIAADVRCTALNILDLCYNMVVGDSLGAREEMLRGSEPVSIDIMKGILDGGVGCQGLISRDESAARGFERVGWLEVMEFMRRAEELEMTERERLAEASRLLARIGTQDSYWLGFAPLLDGLYQGIWWGGLTSTFLAMSSSAMSSGQLLISFLAGFLPAFITTTVPVRPIFRGREVSHLEQRYLAILQTKRGDSTKPET